MSKTLDKKIHIICFDVPYPADYGGVIDSFYRIKLLSDEGYQIHLHIFHYGREPQPVLTDYCKEVYYYRRKTSPINGLGLLPYIVKSRKSEELIENLKKVKAPILFEGLHTTLIIKKDLFKDRKLLVRMHNIEHEYYQELMKSENNLFKRIFYRIESSRLKRYEKILNKVDFILPISNTDSAYLSEKYGEKVKLLPAFHSSEKMHELSKKGYFGLYHGNLKVKDNIRTALYLIDIFKKIDFPFIIAGQTDNTKLLSRIDAYRNLSFIELKNDAQLRELFHRAQVNVFFTRNKSGVKLKLINALFQSRHVIANQKMIHGSGLEPLCIEANTTDQIITELLKIIDSNYTKELLAQRKKQLELYNNKKNIKILINLIQH
ncbi:hypothetical protein LCM02_10170 [Lutimonas saemankumensis]|uniref:hypothetical protein n=1 Tax=Lutimonas saemankumensis TaxID=483016 RepID=UPI001CD28484|nr:hypothetical protein [Lutimonas saemankumensis]MCA0932816.1 hypothetical protein [Lutimonas saemankumensis]